MKRELELKIELFNENTFLDKLRIKGIILSHPVLQQDTVFFRKDKEYCNLSEGEPVIRIRQEKNTTSTALKKYKNGFTDRVEIEFVIPDASAFQNYLEALDIFPVIVVTKYRQKAQYKDAVIHLDRVEGLGIFVEIEIMSDDSRAEADMQKLCAIVSELGLSPDEAIKISYDEMLYYEKSALLYR